MGQRLDNAVFGLYGLLIGGLFGLVAASQVLAFVGAYSAGTVLALTVVLATTAWALYRRHDTSWRATFPTSLPERLPYLLTGIALAVLVGVFALRMVTYPDSSLGRVPPPDATGYHFIKAIELVRTGSFWDLTVPYGQYPIGYESLAALSVALAGDVQWIGALHAVLVIWLWLTLALLLRRYTPLPISALLLMGVALFFVPAFYSFVLLIGKNDLMLSVTLLAAILFAPVGMRPGERGTHIVGLALVTFLAMSTKTSGFVVLALLWLFALWDMALTVRKAPHTWRDKAITLTACIALMLPAALWLVRNLVVMGAPVSPEISSFFIGSIAYNLTNPDLYTSGTESLWLLASTAIVCLIAVGTLLTRRVRLGLLLLALWLAFIITPLSAFHTPERVVLHVEWRYTLHTYFFLAILGLAALSPLLARLYDALTATSARRRALTGACLLLLAGLFVALDIPELNRLDPTNAAIRQDPYTVTSPGPNQGGYPNAYAFIRAELRDRVIYYEAMERFYLYDPDLTLTLSNGPNHPLGATETVTYPTPDVVALGDANLIPTSDWGHVVDDPAWRLRYADERISVYERVERISRPQTVN